MSDVYDEARLTEKQTSCRILLQRCDARQPEGFSRRGPENGNISSRKRGKATAVSEYRRNLGLVNLCLNNGSILAHSGIEKDSSASGLDKARGRWNQ